MENVYDNNLNTNKTLQYTGNPNLEYNRDSSGSRWGDALTGLAQAGLQVMPSNRPAQNYLDINYIGNGLARSSVGSMRNNNYQNPYLLGEYWRNNMRKNRYQFGGGNNGELGNVFGTNNLNKILGTIGVGDFIDESYPSSIYDESWAPVDNIYNYSQSQFTYPTYLDGGSYGDFGKTVLDYFGTNNNIGGV